MKQHRLALDQGDQQHTRTLWLNITINLPSSHFKEMHTKASMWDFIQIKEKNRVLTGTWSMACTEQKRYFCFSLINQTKLMKEQYWRKYAMKTYLFGNQAKNMSIKLTFFFFIIILAAACKKSNSLRMNKIIWGLTTETTKMGILIIHTCVQRKTPVRFRSITSCHWDFFIRINNVSRVIPEIIHSFGFKSMI